MMPRTLRLAVPALVVLLAGEAHAQFANRSLGGGLGFVKFIGGAGKAGVDFAAPLTLEGTLYIENGFDVYARIPLMIVQVVTGADTPTGKGLIFGTGGHIGIRYLFLEENIRPYVGVEVAGFVLITKPEVGVLVGPGVCAGLDFFVADTVSIGLRGNFDLFLQLNDPLHPAFGGAVNFAAYF
jgi:outer membrane protein